MHFKIILNIESTLAHSKSLPKEKRWDGAMNSISKSLNAFALIRLQFNL